MPLLLASDVILTASLFTQCVLVVVLFSYREELNADVIYDVAGVVPPTALKGFWDAVMKKRFEAMQAAVTNLICDGYAAEVCGGKDGGGCKSGNSCDNVEGGSDQNGTGYT